MTVGLIYSGIHTYTTFSVRGQIVARRTRAYKTSRRIVTLPVITDPLLSAFVDICGVKMKQKTNENSVENLRRSLMTCVSVQAQAYYLHIRWLAFTHLWLLVSALCEPCKTFACVPVDGVDTFAPSPANLWS